MADVIIKGVEMPETCYSCHLKKRNGMEITCPILRKSFYVADVNILHYRLKDCPLHTAPEWIPCSEKLPKKSGQYYVSGGEKVWICEFLIIPNFIGGWCNDASNPVVQAWMPLPKPYREGGNENG